jgi:hypothetical protein
MGFVRWGVAAAGLAVLAGCESDPGGGIRTDTRFPAETRQVFQEAYQALPFAEGAVRVISPDPQDQKMRTWRLVPCRQGTRICADSSRGRAGHVTRGAEFWEVSGAYPGRVFYLSPGGDGYMTDGPTALPLAWRSEAALGAFHDETLDK